jgi:ABC-type phosphate transport system substrate-binding protein
MFMGRVFRLLLLVAATGLAAASPAAAQAPPARPARAATSSAGGTITGKHSSAPIPGVTVTVEETSPGRRQR